MAEATALGADGMVATDWGQEERPYEANDQLIGVTYTLHALATGGRRDGAEPGRHTDHRTDRLTEEATR